MTRQRIALITGTNSGIGKALALEFLSRGFKVYATDIKFADETVEEFKAKGGNNVITHTLDVTKLEDIKKIRKIVNEENDSTLDYLYCNAGIVKVKLATDISDADLEQIYNINLFGNIRLVREFVRLVINGKGTIVFSGSVTKFLPVHSNALYCSTKSAVDQYAYVLHTELKNYGVRVYNVLGGAVNTDIFNSGVDKPEPNSVFNFPEYAEQYGKRTERLKESGQDGMEPDVFAKRTLDQLEKASIHKFRIFEGSKALTLYYLGNYIFTCKRAADYFLNLFNLNFDYRAHLVNDRIESNFEDEV